MYFVELRCEVFVHSLFECLIHIMGGHPSQQPWIP